MTTLGIKLRQARKDMRLSQAKAGWLLDLSMSKPAAESKWKRYEIDGQEPTLEELTIISEKMGLNLEWLMSGREIRGPTVYPTLPEPSRLPHDDMLIKSLLMNIDALKDLITSQNKAIEVLSTQVVCISRDITDINARLLNAATHRNLKLLGQLSGTHG